MIFLKPIFIACIVFSPLVFAQHSDVLPCKSKNPDDKRPRIGLVLGGGGARGIAHVSVLKEIERLKVPIDCIAGTSMGSLIGGLYASGMTVEELENMLRTMDWKAELKDNINRKDRSFRRKKDDLESLLPAKPGIGKKGLILPSGYIAGENIRLFLERNTAKSAGITDFNELPIPYRAVATDINTGKAVILESGSLAKAMRASMSIPGAFNPVTINEQILVDGGLVNQVPIDVVRAMGADIIIAVDVGTPLAKIDDRSSALAIGDQVMSFLTVGNTVEQFKTLTDKDVLIQPNLGAEVTTASFDKADLALQIGDEAAKLASPKLARLSQSSLYPRALVVNHDADTVIRFINVINNTSYDDKVFIGKLRPLLNKTINRDEIEKRIRAIYGQYPLELVTYEVLKKDDETGLQVKISPPVVGKRFGEIGYNFSSNSEGQILSNLTTGILIAPLNPSGGELRTLLTIGDEKKITSEWFQPFSPDSDYFSTIKVGYEDSLRSLFNSNGYALAEYSLPNTYINAKIGKEYGNWGEISFEARIANGKLNRVIGDTLLPEYVFKRREVSLNFLVDTLDSLYLPRSGYLADISVVSSIEAWGSDDSYKQFNADLLYAGAIGKHSGFGGVRWHNTFDGNPEFQNWYALGGVTRFAGLQPEQRYVENYAMAYVGYTYELGKLLGRSVVLGGTVESGKLWSTAFGFNVSDYQTHGSAYFGFDSWLGLLIMGYGRSTQGDSNFFVELGRSR
jgi:NTE family protein